MKKQSNDYKYILYDYIYDFIRGFKIERLCFLAYLLGIMYINASDMKEVKWLGGIPIAFTLISGGFHLVSLPMMMYLIPYTKKEREDYIQRMLYVKIAVSVIFALVWDIICISLHQLPFYNAVLQLITTIIIAYVTGTINDGTVETQKKKAVYGDIKEYVGLPLMICYIGGAVMFMICMDIIDRTEFIIILAVIVLIGFFMINPIRKRWRTIRSNFADYEMRGK